MMYNKLVYMFLKDNYDFLCYERKIKDGQLICQDNDGRTLYTAPIFNYENFNVTFHPFCVSFEFNLDREGTLDFKGVKSKSVKSLETIQKVLKISNSAFYSEKLNFDIYFSVVDDVIVLEKEAIVLRPNRLDYVMQGEFKKNNAYALLSLLNLKNTNQLCFHIKDDKIVNDYMNLFLEMIKTKYNIEFDLNNEEDIKNNIKLLEMVRI